jgi:hypothetical protein
VGGSLRVGVMKEGSPGWSMFRVTVPFLHVLNKVKERHVHIKKQRAGVENILRRASSVGCLGECDLGNISYQLQSNFPKELSQS